MEMKDILNRMLNHEELSREETRDIIVGITKSEFPEEQITALLTGLQMRGVTVDELLGFRDGILATGVPAILDCDRYIDVVGTGGDRKNTFNISTTSCFVIAGAGYKVAKHGNYAATSVSGASNVIRNHGVQFTDDMDKLNRSINEAGIVYLHAQLFAKAMKFVGPIRKALQFPTVFNLLGPLVNPSQPKCQLLGVANLDQMRLYNQVYQKLGIDFGIVAASLTQHINHLAHRAVGVFRPFDDFHHHLIASLSTHGFFGRNEDVGGKELTVGDKHREVFLHLQRAGKHLLFAFENLNHLGFRLHAFACRTDMHQHTVAIEGVH